jgi:hypothetical protein
VAGAVPGDLKWSAVSLWLATVKTFIPIERLHGALKTIGCWCTGSPFRTRLHQVVSENVIYLFVALHIFALSDLLD